MLNGIEIHKPDDCHVHFRQGEMMKAVIGAHHWAGRVVVMPNTKPPIRTVAEALAYREEILAHDVGFEPKMTLYLTDQTTPHDIEDLWRERDKFAGCKLYPAGATTGSEFGVSDIKVLIQNDVIKAMEANGIPLLIHGEVVGDDIDFFEREANFCDFALIPLLMDFPKLRTVLEHVSTDAAVHVVERFTNCYATVTPQHLLCNRNHLFKGSKLQPHNYCLPVLKHEKQRQSVVKAVMHDNARKFFCGTDSAPHPRRDKETQSCCGGCFTAPHAIELYAQAFADNNALDERFDNFMSRNGAAFYGWEPSEEIITVVRHRWDGLPDTRGGELEIVPWHCGKQLDWQVAVKY